MKYWQKNFSSGVWHKFVRINMSLLWRGSSAAWSCWTGAGAGLLCDRASVQEHGHGHFQVVVACFQHVLSDALCGPWNVGGRGLRSARRTRQSSRLADQLCNRDTASKWQQRQYARELSNTYYYSPAHIYMALSIQCTYSNLNEQLMTYKASGLHIFSCIIKLILSKYHANVRFIFSPTLNCSTHDICILLKRFYFDCLSEGLHLSFIHSFDSLVKCHN